MKLLLRLAATVILASAAACGHDTSATLGPVFAAPLALSHSEVPVTVHVIPFYNYGKSGYEGLGGVGGNAGLIGSASALYGTTLLGGDTKCSTPFNSGSNTGCGIVYRLVPNSGKQTYKLQILHAFAGAPEDGAASFATLFADKNGDIYGTTFYGGEYNSGTLFKLRPSTSSYTILHSFGYGQDGAYPMAGVIEANGILYGMTNGGGAYTNQRLCGTSGGSPNGTCGTLYSVNASTGAEQVLHSFGGAGDGANPYRAELVDVNGTLYGTTYLGGTLQLCGTVFSIGTDGSGEHVIHSFLNNPRDGCDPLAGVTYDKGTLYGTTCCGGGYYCSYCEGTLFSVDLSTGQEAVLHKFGNGDDGSQPDAGVIAVQGTIYGTTGIGGGTPCQSGKGCGTIFSFAPSSSNPAYTVLHRFKRLVEGVNPSSPLLYSRHVFFGTTVYGGKKNLGTGVKLTQ